MAFTPPNIKISGELATILNLFNFHLRHVPKPKQKYIETIGRKLREIRLEKGFTGYKNFAQIHDLDPRQYLRLENGESDFQISSLLNILEIHDLTPSEFFNTIDTAK